MKKRAAVARALSMDPEFSFSTNRAPGLDPIIAAGIDQLILELKQAFHMTIIVVDPRTGQRFPNCRSDGIHRQRHIIAQGTPAEMKANPRPASGNFSIASPNRKLKQELDYLQMLTADHRRVRR